MGVMHAYTGQLLPVAGAAAAAADDLTVAVDLSVFRLLSSEAASHAAVNTGHSRSCDMGKTKSNTVGHLYSLLITIHEVSHISFTGMG